MCLYVCYSYDVPNHLLRILQMCLLLGLRPNITGEKGHPLPIPALIALKGEGCYIRIFLTDPLHPLGYPLSDGDMGFKAMGPFGKDNRSF